jgi:segregation and condensation protein B
MLDYLIRIASEPKKPRLTPTLMETLSIIAFKQPVTRMEVENIRGVNSDFAINRLISFDLVCEMGRKEVPGRPLLFGTTEQFLRSFGLSSVNDLPEPDTSRMEEFREEAEEEVNTGLNV